MRCGPRNQCHCSARSPPRGEFSDEHPAQPLLLRSPGILFADQARTRHGVLCEELRLMAVVRRTVKLGHAARAQARIKLRQPLRAAVVVAIGEERESIERFAALVREELNVRALRFVSQADELGELEVKPNYRTLGPRFGKDMPLVAAAVAGLDPSNVAAALREGGTIGISLTGKDHEVGADDLLVSMKPLEGYQVEREGSHAVALELELDDDLRREGLARDIVRDIQRVMQRHGGYIAGETLATSVSYESLDGAEPVQIDGRDLRIGVALT